MQALQRILAILEVVASRPDASASVAANETGLSLSTAARLMTQLTSEGVLAKLDDGRYIIGPRIVEIARAGSDRFDLRAVAQPLLDQLRDETGETTSLHVRADTQRICIAASSSRHAVSRVVPVGLALPLPGSATGEVLLSGLPREALGTVTATMTDQEREALEKRVDIIRERGWALVSDTFVGGVTGLAAAVKDSRGVVAALSCSGPTQRFTPKVARSHVESIMAAAEHLSSLHSRTL